VLARGFNGSNFGFRLRDEMDRLFQDFLGNAPSEFGWGEPGRAYPALNLWEEGERLVAEIEVPGLKMEDLEISVLGDKLTIKGERRGHAAEPAVFHRRERGVGEFSRVVRFPVQVNTDRVEATLKNGVLTIRLPKSETALPKKVLVKGA